MYSVLCSLAFTTLILLAAPSFSLPASQPPVSDLQIDVGVDTPLGPMAETSEHSTGGDVTNGSPSAELKGQVFSANLHNANALIMVIMALQQHADMGSAALVREKCNDIVAKLAPAANDTACPWQYKCAYHEHRYPHFGIDVTCLTDSSRCTSCNSQDSRETRVCQRVREPRHVIFLQRNSTAGTWKAIRENMVTSCQCRA